MNAIIGETRDVASEYRKTYPDEEKQYQRVKQEENLYRVGKITQLESNETYKFFGMDDFFSRECYLKRWGIVMIKENERLKKFLKSPRKMGDIFRRKVFLPFSSNYYQTMKNTSALDHIYEYGKNFVSIGYVDLSPLLWGAYQNKECGKPMHFYGYEASIVAHLRSKTIHEMLKMDEKETSIGSILQVALLFFLQRRLAIYYYIIMFVLGYDNMITI